MKMLFDLFPVLLFFVSFKLAHTFPSQAASVAAATVGSWLTVPLVPTQIPILLATVVAILATTAQVGWLLARKRKVEPMLWISFVIIVVFGGATVYLQDETFIKWKPSILYWAFALILAAGAAVWKKNLVRTLLGQTMALPDSVWQRLNWAWTAFFAFMGALNLWVAFHTATEVWVNFKLFGLLGLTLFFALGMGLWLSRYLKEVKEAPNAK